MGRELESIIFVDRGERKIHNRSEIIRKLQVAGRSGQVGETVTILSEKFDVLGAWGLSRKAALSGAEFAVLGGGSYEDITLPALLSLPVQKYKKRRP